MKRILFFLCLFLLVLTGGDRYLHAVSTGQREESSEELFVRSAGYQALKEKKYEAALAEIKKLMSLRAKDPYLLKMKGVLLARMGREEEGISLLKKSLEINPLDRQARLYLAESLMKKQKNGEAKSQLRFIIEDPDDLGYYEDKAQRALSVIEGKPLAKPEKKGKRWKIFGTYGYEYDDNVALQSTVPGFKVHGDRNADRFSLKNGLSYDYVQDSSKKLGVSYTFSQSLHTDSLQQFNFRNHSLQHYATFFTQFYGRPVSLGLKYSFAHGTLQNTTFSSSNSLLPWVSYEPIDNVVVSTYNNFSVINYRNKGFSNDISSRDGLYNTVGTMVTLLFLKRKGSLSSSYEFGYNQTEGDNFDAQVHGTRTILRTPLIEKLKGEASFSVVDDNHYNFASLPHREDLHYTLGAKLIRPLGKYLEVRLLYTFAKVNNTHAGALGHFQYSRHIVGGEVSFNY